MKLTQEEIAHGIRSEDDDEITLRCVPKERADKSGYHWVRRFENGPVIVLWWNPDWHTETNSGWGGYAQPDREDQWEYLGPCLSPDAVRDILRQNLGHVAALNGLRATLVNLIQESDSKKLTKRERAFLEKFKKAVNYKPPPFRVSAP